MVSVSSSSPADVIVPRGALEEPPSPPSPPTLPPRRAGAPSRGRPGQTGAHGAREPSDQKVSLLYGCEPALHPPAA